MIVGYDAHISGWKAVPIKCSQCGQVHKSVMMPIVKQFKGEKIE